jgi:hypothetical protein
VSILDHRQAGGKPVAQHSLHRLGHGCAGLARAEQVDVAICVQVIGFPCDLQMVVLALHLRLHRSVGIDRGQGGSEDGEERLARGGVIGEDGWVETDGGHGVGSPLLALCGLHRPHSNALNYGFSERA